MLGEVWIFGKKDSREAVDFCGSEILGEEPVEVGEENDGEGGLGDLEAFGRGKVCGGLGEGFSGLDDPCGLEGCPRRRDGRGGLGVQDAREETEKREEERAEGIASSGMGPVARGVEV